GPLNCSLISPLRTVGCRTRIRLQDRQVCIAPQTLRGTAAYPSIVRTLGFDLSPFARPSFGSIRTRRRGLDRLRADAAYLGGLGCKRGGTYHRGNIRSA